MRRVTETAACAIDEAGTEGAPARASAEAAGQ
jgi:hypothetical protein